MTVETEARVDAVEKAVGAGLFTADRTRPGMLWTAVVRSEHSRARILSIDTTEAATISGVVGFLDHGDVQGLRYGRTTRDVPILADGEVRFVGEPVVAVVAESRRAAADAADLVTVDYEPLPDVIDASTAAESDSPLVHVDASQYDGADASSSRGRNLQALVEVGDRTAAEAALARSDYVVSHVYTTSAVHQAYLEPHACVAEVDDVGRIHVWVTNKSPYYLKNQLATCFDVPPDTIVIHSVLLGGDFGGKGSPMCAPLCIAVARKFGRPAKIVMSYNEELSAGNPRHPATIRLSLGCDAEGTFSAAMMEAILDGGAYAGFKFTAATVAQILTSALGSYSVPISHCEVRSMYTNTVPKGHMRLPSGPQGNFAVESAVDELATALDMDPIELRLRNVAGAREEAAAAREVLLRVREARAAEGDVDELASETPGPWRVGRGLAFITRRSPPIASPALINMLKTSLRLSARADGTIEVQTSTPETGTGSHTVLRKLLAEELGIDRESLRVVRVGTEELVHGVPASGSLVTATLVQASRAAARAWRARGDASEVLVEYVPGGDGERHGESSSCVQEAVVAVDVETGRLKVLELRSFVGVGRIINEKAHQMQIDGGAIMGLGYALMEDLGESGGQVWAAQMGEYKIPTMQDVPRLTTVLLPSGSDHTHEIGETTNVPTAPAIANALFDAVRVRMRHLPIKAEPIFDALRSQPVQAHA